MVLFATLTPVPGRALRVDRSGRSGSYAAGAALGPDRPHQGDGSLVIVGRGLRLPRADAGDQGPRLRTIALASLAVHDGDRRSFPARRCAWPGATSTGENYLAWQLFRRPNHDWIFYPPTVPRRSAWVVVARRGARPVAAAPQRSLAGDAPAVLDRRAGRVLPALAGQGLPVPAADRAGGRGPRGARHRPAAAPASRRLGWSPAARRRCVVPRPRRDRGDRADAGRPDVGAHPALDERRPSSPAPAACPAAARPAAGSRDNVPEGAQMLTLGPSMANIIAVLRPPQGLRALGEPEPAAPQPVLRAGRQPGPADPRTTSSSTSSGTRSRRAGRRSSRGRLLALRRPLPRPGRPHGDRPRADRRRHDRRASRDHRSTRCGHETRGRARPVALRRRSCAALAPSAARPPLRGDAAQDDRRRSSTSSC